jgi:hypothetical protein
MLKDLHMNNSIVGKQRVDINFNNYNCVGVYIISVSIR